MAEKYKLQSRPTAQVGVKAGGNIQAKPMSTAGSQALASAGASMSMSLAGRLEEFSTIARGIAKETAKKDAVEQASQDALEGKEFHEESVYTVYGRAYNDARSATFLSQSEQLIQERSAELAKTNKNNPIAYRKAMNKYITDLSKNAPSAELQSTIKIGGSKLSNKTFFSLESRNNERLKTEQKTTWANDVNMKIPALINAKSSGNTRDFDLLMENLGAHTSSMIENGIVSDVEAGEILRKATYQVERGSLENQVDDLLEQGNTEEALKIYQGIKDKIPEGTTVSEHTALELSIGKKLTAYNKVIRANKKINTTNANKAIDDEITVLQSGGIPETPLTDAQISGASIEKQEAYYEELEIQKEITPLQELSLVEQEEKLAKYKGRKTKTATDVRVEKRLSSILTKRKAGWNNDPITQGGKEGLYAPTKPMTFENQDEWGEIINTRFSMAQLNQAEMGQGGDTLLTKQEATQFTDYLGKATIEDQQELLTQISGMGSDISKKIYKQISKGDKGGVFAVSGMMGNIGNSNAAEKMLQGYKSDVKTPEDFRVNLQDKISGIFGVQDKNQYNAVIDSITAYTKGIIFTSPEADIDVDEMIKQTFGTPITLNNKKTLTPYGVSEDDFEDWIDDKVLEGADYSGMFSGDSGLGSNYQLQYVENNKYMVYTNINGLSTPVGSPEDETQPYILTYGE